MPTVAADLMQMWWNNCHNLQHQRQQKLLQCRHRRRQRTIGPFKFNFIILVRYDVPSSAMHAALQPCRKHKISCVGYYNVSISIYIYIQTYTYTVRSMFVYLDSIYNTLYTILCIYIF